MSIFNSIQWHNTDPACRKCQNCIHFQNHPTRIEAAYPGLKTMSSGYASVRDRDGLCDHHQRYLSARDCCQEFSRR